ncbi:hypothetical protein F4813DRAFT_126977 [Daldinia decipiens]|uniref:uncharacterized protein n=1 Tax=Daldinia decipiens TaxID=326647 RepID=UPI0020C4DA2F|nr:uncharacterized protein F4813DRAFT_126977 [Daldinia decipiens]KAI1656505.1 hypothetical protein F4813DRAFT_126977 [Daldinia decipiens]
MDDSCFVLLFLLRLVTTLFGEIQLSSLHTPQQATSLFASLCQDRIDCVFRSRHGPRIRLRIQWGLQPRPHPTGGGRRCVLFLLLLRHKNVSV